MQIIGVEVPGGPPALSFALGHGEDPYQVVWEQGYKVTRPLSATGTVEDLTVTLQVAEHHRPIVPRGAPDFVQRVTSMMLDGKGDLLPVSALTAAHASTRSPATPAATSPRSRPKLPASARR